MKWILPVIIICLCCSSLVGTFLKVDTLLENKVEENEDEDFTNRYQVNRNDNIKWYN